MATKRKKNTASEAELESSAAPVRSLWSGTITFGLVSIPVDLLSAVRPRQTAMKLVDRAGHALGRRYHCSKEGKELDQEDLVRGYETDDGKIVVITDAEFESVAPEMSADIELRNFVPLEQIPSIYFQRPYFLAPSGKSSKAYHLLSATMERSGRVAIGSFVMRGHEYLVAIVSDNGVLRADTLRYADEIRSPELIGLPKRKKVPASKVTQFAKVVEELTSSKLEMAELEDHAASALEQLVQSKQADPENVVHPMGLEEEDPEAGTGGAQIIDLMEVLRKSLSKDAVVSRATSSPPISLAERRAEKEKKHDEDESKRTRAQKEKNTSRRPAKKVTSKRKSQRKSAKRAG